MTLYEQLERFCENEKTDNLIVERQNNVFFIAKDQQEKTTVFEVFYITEKNEKSFFYCISRQNMLEASIELATIIRAFNWGYFFGGLNK